MPSLFFILKSHKCIHENIIEPDQTVLADLRVLEEQQSESQRKLETSRITKQRGMQQQSELEAKLDQLKYKNGQQRAELHNFHERLSEGQRMLVSARSVSGKAGDDLRSFDSELKLALETKRTLLTFQRKQTRLLDILSNRIIILEQLVNSEEELMVDANKQYCTIKQREENLRQRLHEENTKLQQIADKTATSRSSTFKAEKELDSMDKFESELSKEFEKASIQAENDHSEHVEGKCRFQSQSDKFKVVIKELSNKNSLIQDLNELGKQEVHKLCTKKNAIQFDERQTGGKIPTDLKSLPSLDINRIRESAIVEAKAAEDEETAKSNLQASVTNLHSQLSKLNEEYSKATNKSSTLSLIVQDSMQLEKDRSELQSALIKELDLLKIEVDRKHDILLDHRSKAETEQAQATKEWNKTCDAVANRSVRLFQATEEKNDICSKIDTQKTVFEEAKTGNETRMEKTRNEFKKLQQSVKTLTEKLIGLEAGRLEESDEEENEKLFEQKRMTEKYEQSITNILTSTYFESLYLIPFQSYLTCCHQSSSCAAQGYQNCVRRKKVCFRTGKLRSQISSKHLQNANRSYEEKMHQSSKK